jgi:hypothetical protein
MWVVMMVAMMLPSLVPMLWRYRQAVGSRSSNNNSLDVCRIWAPPNDYGCRTKHRNEGEDPCNS